MRFEKLKNDILGKEYSLSIAFVSAEKSRELNKKYRKRDNATNILSFALRKGEGELVLCKEVIKKEAREKKFGRNYTELLGFLVIHGMLHLKGYAHSSTMEGLEKEYDTKYFGGHRHGFLHDASRGGRIYQGRKKS